MNVTSAKKQNNPNVKGSELISNQLVSVIIPTYNREHTILRSVNSVLGQSYDNIQLIVIDDASTDRTVDILEKNVHDDRLRIVRQEHGGACKARNLGYDLSEGELIAFQDSDDEWHSNKIQLQLNNMQNRKSEFDFCSMEVVDNSKRKPIRIPPRTIPGGQIHRRLLHGNFISSQMLLMKRGCLEEIRWNENIPRMQDYNLMLSVSKKYTGSHTDIVLVRQYIQADSISLSGAENFNKAKRIIWEEHKDDFVMYPKEASLYLASWAKTCVNVLSDEDYWSLIRQALSYKMSFRAIKSMAKSLLLKSISRN